MRFQTPASWIGRSRASAIRQHGQTSGRWAILSEASSLKGRLCPAWPGLAPAGLARSRLSFRSVDGGLEDVRDVLSGRCGRSTNSTSSALLRGSSSSRRMPGSHQPTHSRTRGWVTTVQWAEQRTSRSISPWSACRCSAYPGLSQPFGWAGFLHAGRLAGFAGM
jgi:hypothetical protein